MHLLLEKGADPNIATFAGTTPMMAAAGVNWVGGQTYSESKQFLEAVELCLEKGADVNAVNSMGITAVIGAVESRIGRHRGVSGEERRGARCEGQARAHADGLGGRSFPRHQSTGEEAKHDGADSKVDVREDRPMRRFSDIR